MILYCLSGLGVDKRSFQNIHPEGVELVHIEWIDPEKNETLADYAKRLFDKINHEDNYNLLGVSFGGMIAVEFAKIKKPGKLFLVSTITNKKELPLTFKIGGVLRLHKIIPTALLRNSNFITNYLFSVHSKEDKKLLKEILHDTDPHFLKWAMNAIVYMSGRIDIHPESANQTEFRIHGLKDKMLPMKFHVNYIVENGGHFMIVSRGEEISRIISSITTDLEYI